MRNAISCEMIVMHIPGKKKGKREAEKNNNLGKHLIHARNNMFFWNKHVDRFVRHLEWIK